jgi:hypothetical protein
MSADHRLRHRLHELEAREVKHVKLQESFADLERSVLQWKNAHNTLSAEHVSSRQCVCHLILQGANAAACLCFAYLGEFTS